MGKAIEKGAQIYPGQVLAAGGTQVTTGGTQVSMGGTQVSTGGMQVSTGGTQVSMGRTKVARGRDESCMRAGCRRDPKLSSPLSRSIYQAKIGGTM